MQDSWRERIVQDKDLLSLGNPKSFSFSGDGGGGGQQLSWKASEPLAEASNGNSSSAVISQSDHSAEEKVSGENSDQSGSVLKVHDYIGMADISSAAPVKYQLETDTSQELNSKETDLCLGLGLGLAPSTKAESVEDTGKTIAFTFSRQGTVSKTVVDPAAASNISAKYAFVDGATGQRSLQTAWPNAPVRTITVDNSIPSKANGDIQAPQMCLPVQEFGSSKAGAPRGANVFPGSACVAVPSAALKNANKRGYMEAMSDVARFNMSSEAVMVVKSGDADVKALPKHPQSSFLSSWAPSKSTVPTPWHVALEQPAGLPFGSNQPASVLVAPRVEKPAVDCAAAAYKGSQSQSEAAQESAINEAPPPKGQVVGWPPIRSYRRNTLAKPTEMFVKVNMDGVTVGRKVDLNAHNSYEGLLSALEEMFQPSSSAQGASQAGFSNDTKHCRLLNGSAFVLTYEDKDGDWMLVGDVPWSMFTNTVRRLRITRGPEATGLGPRGSEELK